MKWRLVCSSCCCCVVFLCSCQPITHLRWSLSPPPPPPPPPCLTRTAPPLGPTPPKVPSPHPSQCLPHQPPIEPASNVAEQARSSSHRRPVAAILAGPVAACSSSTRHRSLSCCERTSSQPHLSVQCDSIPSDPASVEG